MSRAFVDGMDRDCLEIEYLAGDKIRPHHKIGHIYRYRSVSNVKPKLDKLGGSTWIKRITKVKEKALAMAHELCAFMQNEPKPSVAPILSNHRFMIGSPDLFPMSKRQINRVP